MSLCGSHLSAGSSGRSSSPGNPHTRCAQRQGLPAPRKTNGDQELQLQATTSELQVEDALDEGTAGNFIIKLSIAVKITFSSNPLCQEGVSCLCYLVGNTKKIC